MKEFIDKLIERLEEYEYSNLIEHDSEQCSHCQGNDDDGCGFRDCFMCVWDKAIEIVTELAEEYKVSEMPTGWISVSERLPEVNKKVLAFDVFSGISIEKLEEDEEFIESVIAWMPLPSPYTEGE